MKKINLLIISGISSVILFFALSFIQNKIINKEEMGAVYVSNVDVQRDMAINKNDIKQMYVPIHLIKDTDAIINIKDFDGKYAKEAINKGQIIFKQDIASKEELKIIEYKEGLEKIAVKIKNAENAIAYQIKPKDRIHLYFTGKSNVVEEVFLKNGTEFKESKNDNLLRTAKIIQDIEILGMYDEMGRSFSNDNFTKLDTIVIAVEPSLAEMINNLRTQGTFDITG